MIPLIVIVEDDDKSRKLVRDVLSTGEYHVMEAVNGEQGIALIKSHKPNLVIMDIRLPDISGIEAMLALQRFPETKYIPAIAITASAMRDDKEKILRAGFQTYLPKPIRFRELLSTVDQILKKNVG